MTHHRHYLLYIQGFLLLSLLVMALGRNGIERLAGAVPFLICVALMYVTVRLCVNIIKMVDPELAGRRGAHMHGSTLPILVYAPQN